MSESINNSGDRKALLKHMILQLHEGIAPEDVRKQLVKLLSKIPYNEVVEVEQELIAEGLPETEVLRLCDVHTEALEGHIDLSGMKIAPPGHPVDTFKKENQELRKVVTKLQELFENAEELYRTVGAESYNNRVKGLFNSLMDVDKHYRRKENLLFPFLERYGITGPPKVMWGKHDETRDLLKNALRALDLPAATADQMKLKTDLHLRQAAKAISDMIMKEEEILLPMTLDKLTESDWYEIYRQTNEIGYCLYDPDVEWKPEGITPVQTGRAEGDAVKLPSGSFSVSELLALLNTMPVDITFVDKNDRVKYFSQGKERIFDRNRAIIGRDVRMCHPPSSVHVVEKILNDFKSGNETTAAFWIQMQGRFIHIEYFALRDPDGNYLGVLEVSQDLTEKRSLQGEQRILSYAKSTRH
jgi:PAS domain S-box-containing protein